MIIRYAILRGRRGIFRRVPHLTRILSRNYVTYRFMWSPLVRFAENRYRLNQEGKPDASP